MSGRIYLLNDGGSRLLAMEETAYDSEPLLQELLANHPDLLAGDQMNDEEPRRWLLITREQSIPGGQDGGGVWSLDHLFLDQEAVPTLVEVKRSTDTRIRREVVGQMLDYAANAVAYLPVEDIRARYEARCERCGEDPDEVLAAFMGENGNGDDFWQKVKTNLQAGRIRLVFIADSIPPELRRIVEFLNGQMDPAEVLAVEVKQFVGEGMKTLVPRLIGSSEVARHRKSAGRSASRQWDEPSFLEAVTVNTGPEAARVAKDLLDWIRPQVSHLWYGSGTKHGGIIPIVQIGSTKYHVGRLATQGWFAFRFDWLMRRAPFASEEVRRHLLEKLNRIPGADFPESVLTTRARIPFDQLVDPAALAAVKEAIAWLIAGAKEERQS